MNILLFEDFHVDSLAPVTSGRPAFAVLCGGYHLYDLVAKLGASVATCVRPHLVDLVTEDFPSTPAEEVSDSNCLCINARIAPTRSNLNTLSTLLKDPACRMVLDGDHVAAAMVPESWLSSWKTTGYRVPFLNEKGCPESAESLKMFRHLHDLIRVNSDSINENIQLRMESNRPREIADGVFSTDKNAKPDSPVVYDTRSGPILLEDGCSIGPFSVLKGPIHLASHCQVAAHSLIGECVSAGARCKLGGEIEATVIEGYTNKQHHGFLGHSYLGSWINIGAGTCNSDLKNTYGNVNMQCGDRKIATGMQFVGCFIGDYSKTAINTSIYTGKTIGVCSMVYGSAFKNVAPFTNDIQMSGEVTEVDPDVMVQTQARMFARRSTPQRDCDKKLIHAMFRLSAARRSGLACRPPVW